MKDLASSISFRKHNAHAFDRILQRVIPSNQWDAKLDEIKRWEKQQELEKQQGTEDDLGAPYEMEDDTKLSPQEAALKFAQTKQTAYGAEVNKIRESLGINQPSQFQGNDMMRKPKQNIFSKWLNFGKAGRQLSTLEIENNKKLLNGAKQNNQSDDLFNNNSGTTVQEDTKHQEFRMNLEDWKSYLYSYRLSGYLAALSAFATAIKMNVLFTPAYFPLIASLISGAYLGFKLTDFNDGPFVNGANRNYFGNDNQLNRYINNFKQAEQQAKQTQPKSKQTTNNDDLFNDDNLDSLDNEFDNKDEDDGEVELTSDDFKQFQQNQFNKGNSINSHHEPSKATHLGQTVFKDDGKSIPQSDINVNNNHNLYEHEEEFLKMVYRNRAKLANHLNTPYDILKTFAPLIVNFNKEFADTAVLNNTDWKFKNIAYLIGSTYEQISATFRNAGSGEDAKYNPDYYFFIDEITETGLFYKVKLRLPDCIQRDYLLKNMEKMKGNLRLNEDDVVDISTELPNNVGYLKIYKITTGKGGAHLPLVSTGDVMRFKNMKTKSGKNLIEDLNQPDDMKILFGLSNAEDALTLDIGGNQNTSIAITGYTGSGKTASTGSWLVNLLVTHSPDEVGFIIVDPKTGSFWRNFKLAPHVLGYFDEQDTDKVPIMMKILREVEDLRQRHLNQDIRMENYYVARRYFKEKGNWERVKTVPRLFIVMDEQLSLMGSLGTLDASRKASNKPLQKKDHKFEGFLDLYLNQIGSLANVIREGGMTIMALSQQNDYKHFPRPLLAGSTIKFMMRLKFQQDAERLMGEEIAKNINAKNMPVGSGYLSANGLNLAQLTTPLFSGNPSKLTELTRIIALAWVIIYSYNHNESIEPKYYYLSQASKENAKNMKAENIDIYNVFNRDQLFKEAKDTLKQTNNQVLHFDPEYHSNFSIDLDKDENQQSDISLRSDDKDKYDDNMQMQNELNDLENADELNDFKEDDSLNIDNLNDFKEDDSLNIDNLNDFNSLADSSNDDKLTSDNKFNSTIDSNASSKATNLKESIKPTSTTKSINNSVKDNSNDDLDNKTNEDVNSTISLNDLIKQATQSNVDLNNHHHNIAQNSYSEYNDMDKLHKTEYEQEFLNEAYRNKDYQNPQGKSNSVKSVNKSHNESQFVKPQSSTANNIVEGSFAEINNSEQSINPSKSNDQTLKEKTASSTNQKYSDDAAGLIQFFQQQQINAISTEKLLKNFSFKAIKEAIDKNLVSVDAKTNTIKMIYK